MEMQELSNDDVNEFSLEYSPITLNIRNMFQVNNYPQIRILIFSY